MGKIKGWEKSYGLEDTWNTDDRAYAITIDYFTGMNKYIVHKNSTFATRVGTTGRKKVVLGLFDTKKEAKKIAMKYMRENPNG